MRRAQLIDSFVAHHRDRLCAWNRLDCNESSRRVSEKLGYRETHLSSKSPRGKPVVSHEVRLERAGWQCPVAVEIEGLAQCLELLRLVERSPERA